MELMQLAPGPLVLAFGKSLLFVLAAILPILNPAASAPVFLSMTEGAPASTRALLARRIARNIFLLLTGSMLIGSYVLDFFGISLPIVRVGGGAIVIATAWQMLTASHDSLAGRSEPIAEAFTPEQVDRQAFYPMTFPLSCGPGSISAAITVGVALHDPKLAVSAVRMGGALLGLLLISTLSYLAYRYAHRLLAPLGEAGTLVFLRLMAFILLCLGVQIVWDGASELLRGVLAA